jgi:DNA-binding CsgD family transcriptional regulator
VLLARAAELTPDASRRGVRMLQAAAADFTGGQVPRAQAALEQALPMLHDPFVSAQARRLEGAIQYRLGMNAHSPSTLLQAAIELYAFDVRLARETALEALQMAVLFGAFATHRTRDVARAAKHMPLPPGLAPTSSDLLLEGLAEYFSSGPVTAAPALRRAVDAVVADPAARELPRRLSFGIYAAFALGDNDALRTLGAEYVALARRDALDDLPEALHYLGTLELRNGTLLRADSHFTEEGNFQMMSVYGRVYGPQDVGRLMVLAWRGVEAPARAWASMLASMADERQYGWTAARVDAALATLELGLGNYAAATGGASDGWQDDIAINCIVAADVIEAHVRSGTPERTGEYIACLEERAAATNMQLELGLLARSRALLSDGEDAEPLYREAITCLTQNGGLFHVARAQLLYGEWLRRKRRRTDAREQLRAAHQTFNALSVAAFAERARIELRATGETARKRTHDTRDDLTPQETQVATIAASGATNSEIAAQMFISANTVDYHLRKVYRKLGITSRRALATAMRTGEALP